MGSTKHSTLNYQLCRHKMNLSLVSFPRRIEFCEMSANSGYPGSEGGRQADAANVHCCEVFITSVKVWNEVQESLWTLAIESFR